MQARVYICLHALDKGHAKTLSRLCKLPRQDVYKTLSELYEIGLVEKALTRPIEFRAIPTDRCLSLLTERENKKYNEIKRSAAKVFSAPLKTSLTKQDSFSAQILLIPKKEPTHFKARDLINLAQQSICVISPHQNLFPWIDEDAKEIRKALERRVNVRFITDSQNGNNRSHWSSQTFQGALSPVVRYLEHSPSVSLGIYDDKKLIFELSAAEGFLGSDVIVTENPSLVDMAATYFRVKWDQAV
jgi:sugar-specific transcriptional regulator TrmB